MPIRARSRSAGAILALGTFLLVAGPLRARAAEPLSLDPAGLNAPAQPAMCPAQRAREAESQLFAVRNQLALHLEQEPADPSFKVLNTRGANYATGQNITDPALFHFERASAN